MHRHLIAAVLGLMLLAASMGAAPAAPLQRIVVSQGFINVVPVSFWVARERAFFRKHGVNVEIIHVRGSTQATQALIAGSVDVDMASPPQFFNAIAAGADLVEFATIAPTMPYLFATRPGIRSAQDLRGKRLGTAGQGLTLAQLAEMIALRSYGLDPMKDVTYLAIGPEPDRIAALKQGTIDATVFGTEFRIQVEAQGLQVIADLAKLNLPWEHDMLAANRGYLRTHRDAVDGLLRGLLEANAYILNPANKRFVMRIIAEQLHFSSVQEAEVSYTLALDLFVKKKPYPNVRGLEAMLEVVKTVIPTTAKLQVSAMVDDSLLRAIDESGWIDKLYKR